MRLKGEDDVRWKFADIRVCEFCSKVYKRKLTDQYSSFVKRRVCSARCQKIQAHKAEWKPAKFCSACGKELPGTSPRIYCSQKCFMEPNVHRRIFDWLVYDKFEAGLAPSMKAYIRKIKGNKCWKCGWAEKHPKSGEPPTQFHHKDGNNDNNSFQNIELLCPNCHSLTENYAGFSRKGRD